MIAAASSRGFWPWPALTLPRIPDRRSLRIGSETTQADVEAIPDVGGRRGCCEVFGRLPGGLNFPPASLAAPVPAQAPGWDVLGEFPLNVVRIECERCGRAGSYRHDGLVAQFGADIALPDLLVAVRDTRPERVALRGAFDRARSRRR